MNENERRAAEIRSIMAAVAPKTEKEEPKAEKKPAKKQTKKAAKK